MFETKFFGLNHQLQSSKTNWTGPRGYGRRHPLDEADFSLWDTSKGDFRCPTADETRWLGERYNASRIALHFPIMIIETECPPHPLPPTVAGVATNFVPPPKPVDSSTSNARSKSMQDTRPITHSTNYLGVRGPKDPLHFAFPRWIRPTDDQLKSLIDILFQLCNPRLVYILCPWIIVELCCDDNRVYESGSLPRKIGGYAAVYHQNPGSALEGLSLHGRRRNISPTAMVQDPSNYLNRLCPGVRVESEILTTPAGQTSMSSTAGLLVRNTNGHQRLTVSNHGFLNDEKVFHPSNVGTQIGKIDERWPSLDIALVKLDRSVEFANDTYFEAKPPKRLLRGQETTEGDWYVVDGMSTGLVFLQAQGIRLDFQDVHHRSAPSRSNNGRSINYQAHHQGKECTERLW